MAQVCLEELNIAALWVEGNSEACDCLEQPFRTAFPAAVQPYFDEISQNGTTEDGGASFCHTTDDSICQKVTGSLSCESSGFGIGRNALVFTMLTTAVNFDRLIQDKASCCCQQNSMAYAACFFVSGVVVV